MKKKVFNREDILGISDIKIVEVSIPEWGLGATVWVRGMTGAERDKYDADMFQPLSGKKPEASDRILNLSNLRAKLCSMTICDEDGKRLFTTKDVQALSQKSAAALQRIFVVAQRLSGISEEEVEGLAKELEERPFEDSASASPGI